VNFSFLVVLLFVSKCTTKNMVKYLSFTSFLVNTMKWLAGEPAVDPMSVIKHLATAARPNGSTYAVTNLAFLSTALYIGSQWKGDVTYAPVKGGRRLSPAREMESHFQDAIS